MESLASKKKRTEKIVAALKKEYPEAKCRLTFENPFQLLIKTILSAQCTDDRVNIVGGSLFRNFPDPQSFAEASPVAIEEAIHSTGFFRNKAKNIQGACRVMIEKFDGNVPRTMDELLLLPGVGRKTANVILGNVYGIPGLTVDTHVIRISRLLKFSFHKNAEKIETDLMKIVPEKCWTPWGHWIQLHGRTVCIARRPNCRACVLALYCPSNHN